MAKCQVEVYFPLLKMSFDCELPTQLKVKDAACLIIKGIFEQLKTEFVYSTKDAGCLLHYEDEPGEIILLTPESTIGGAGIQDGGRLIIT